MKAETMDLLTHLGNIYSDVQFLQISSYDKEKRREIMDEILYAQHLARRIENSQIEEVTPDSAMDHVLLLIDGRLSDLECREDQCADTITEIGKLNKASRLVNKFITQKAWKKDAT
jgi:hypothetical protein|tara:strand:+ start:5428 stop:5775 length:348 start_codon:yes stop_codon:yes gene_type:complete